MPRQAAAFRNRAIGFVFQDHCLLPQLTVLENVLIPTLVATGDGDSRARATQLDRSRRLARSGSNTGPVSCREASGSASPSPARAGRAIQQLVLCDEPTGNLDRAAADSVASVLPRPRHAASTRRSIVVTHSTMLAEKCPIRFDIVDRQLHRS